MLPSQTSTGSGSRSISAFSSYGPRLKQGFRQRLNGQTLGTMLLVAVALVLGINVANSNWLFVVAIAAIPLLLLRPVEVSLGIFALLVPFDNVGVLSGQRSGTTLTWFVGAATAGTLLAVGIIGGRLEKPGRRTLAWALLIGWGAITILWALDPQLGLDRLPTALSLLVLYFAGASLRITKKELAWVVCGTILGGFVAAAYSIYSYGHGVSYHSVYGATSMRSSLILGEHETDPNQFAASLLLPFSLAFGVFLAARGRLVKMAVLAVLVSILFAIMLTMSRGGLLGVVVTLLVFLYRFRLKLGVIIPVAIGALLLSALPSLFFQRISGSVQDAGAGRAYIWIVGLAALEAYGVFGAGLGNFPVAFDQFAGSSPIPISSGNASHNIYLNTCVELGVIGLVLLVNALRTELSRRPIRKSLSLFHSAVACEAACWGILISGLFLDILWKKSFWLVWILLAAASRLQASPTEGSA